MSTTAGALSIVSVTSNTANLSSAVATAGTAPYTYQWYRSTTTGFTPGPSNILTGKTALTLADTALIPNTTYFYVVKATDSSSPAVAANSTQLTVLTSAATLSQNQFGFPVLVPGQVDMPYNFGTFSAVIDSSAAANTYTSGTFVKIVSNTKGGVPKVVACSSSSDVAWGVINFNLKNIKWGAGDACEVSTAGNVVWLYTTAAVSQGAQVCLDVSATASVQPTGGSAEVVGYALDGAAASGAIIRVRLSTPSFATA